MALDTNFNQNPYYDDFNESKNFHRVLFKPSVAIQARELTQLQSILQNQIERFGDNILKEGTIVKGCSFTFMPNFPYVKILDLQTDGQPVVMSNYNNATAVGSISLVEAKVLAVRTGLVTQSPDLNTLFIRYTKSNGSVKTFSEGEDIVLLDSNGTEIATVTAAGSVESNSIGSGYAIKVTDGIIYQKGYFVRVEEQIAIVSKYGTRPNDIVAGFRTAEIIVNSNNDTTLLDNANGFNNENAPGADRLKLVPTLTILDKDVAEADETFFGLLEWDSGFVINRREKTQYSVIGDEMSRRTQEESGDYIVKDFKYSILNKDANDLYVTVSPGLAYVSGYRVDNTGTRRIEVDKGASHFQSATQQNVTTRLGHYVIVDEYIGHFGFKGLDEVTLYNTAQNRMTAGSVDNTPTGSAIGTANVKAVEYHSGTIGTATCQYRLYLFNIRMSSSVPFSSVKSILYNSGGLVGNADPVLENNRAVIKDPNFKKVVYNIGKSGIKSINGNTADFTYRTFLTGTVQNNGVLSISLTGNNISFSDSAGNVLGGNKLDWILLCDQTRDQAIYTDGKPIDLSNATINIVDSTNATITLSTIPQASAVNATMNVIVYFNVKRTPAAPSAKVSKNVYIKVSAATSGTSGKYSLELPDVYEIISVRKKTSAFTASTEGDDVTSYFNLNTNQRDAYYDLSYVTKKKGLTIGASDHLLFYVKVFEKDTTSPGTGVGYFSIESYDVDLEDIPTFKAENGTIFDLRDCLDFRPFADPVASYSETFAGATTVSTTVGAAPGFTETEYYTAAPNTNAEIDYDYYLGRVDQLFITPQGNFTILEGTAAEDPREAPKPQKGMVIAKITVPPYPALTPKAAAAAGKASYAAKVFPKGIQGYTMDEIGQIDRRVKQLEYYTILNALESSAKDKVILDADGNNRFKNGIFTDSFEDLSIANTTDLEFSAAIDPTEKSITPKIKQFDVDLVIKSLTNTTSFNNLVTLNKADYRFITQPYATTTRNLVTDFYRYNGLVQMFPEYDGAYDVTVAPDFNVDIDLATPFMDFTEALNEIVPLQQTSRDVRTSTSTTWTSDANNDYATTTTVTNINTTTNGIQVNSGSVVQQEVGDFVTDIRFNPYMRSREVRILATGLRPNTTMHFFFDRVLVDEHMARATSSNGSTDITTLRRSSGYNPSGGIVSDANGFIRAIFRIPAETFYVGERTFLIRDTDDINIDDAISNASTTYNAYNFSIDKAGLSFNVRNPQPVNYSRQTSQTLTNTTVQAFPIPTDTGEDGDDSCGSCGNDPLSQTFFIKRNMARNDEVLFATKMDLYFKEKDSTAGVTVQLREVQNGYPTLKEVPLGRVYLENSQVVANTTAGQATTATFPAPIPLKVDTEYCFVVKPDGNNPNFRSWVAKVGETDVSTGRAITQDVNDGTLFSSTNDRTYTPIQDEQLKYSLYKAGFTSDSGSVELTNKKTEYLSIENIDGRFRPGEKAFIMGTPLSGTVAMTEGETTITGSGTTFSGSKGEHIVIISSDGLSYDVLEIDSVDSTTQITTTDFAKFTDSGASYFKSIVGDVNLFDRVDPARLFLDNSTASGNNSIHSVFSAGDVVYGEDSRASATITSVDDKNISYIAPNIYRTNTSNTRTTLDISNMLDENEVSYSKNNIAFNDSTYLNTKATIIKSRSNEILANTSSNKNPAQTFVMEINMSNVRAATDASSRHSSPVIDVESSGVKIYEYIVNNDYTDEDTNTGDAESKYISKTVTLQENLDAEDLIVYLTAYRPSGTTIQVYAKLLSGTDPENIEDKPWTLLDGKASNPISSNVNRNDFKEHEFHLPTSAPVSGAAYLSNGFKYTDGGITYDNFKFFALKIVMLSTGHHRVPRIADIRAIALAD